MEEGDAWENSKRVALQAGRWCYLQIVFWYFYIALFIFFLLVVVFLIQAAIIINSQKKIKNVDLTLQNKLYYQ